ncbi:MAG: tRNA threonylcarbamoyladenosine biosynthesis protein [Nitrospirae bacterium]|nr:MAG: tRNA threonylcarbamoyladenosine biosynthesis protein [Nitrospirota bacterium]
MNAARGNMKAVFLDRDGTLIEDRGYIASPDDVVFLPSTFLALRKLSKNYLLFLVTQQSGVARGILTTENVLRVNNYIERKLSDAGIHIQHSYFCPHDTEDRCPCKKPSPIFLSDAAVRWGLDLAGSYVIGDHPHDVEMAKAAGAQGIYVLSGHGRKHRAELQGDWLVAHDVGEAADWVAALHCYGNQPALLDEAIQKSADAVKKGGVVVFPTETVYGVGASAFNEKAISRIYRMKGRPASNPLIVHAATSEKAFELTTSRNGKAELLADHFWPGPLTLIMRAHDSVPSPVRAGLPTVAVRVPGNPVARAFIQAAGCPIAAPSANPSGFLSPVSALHSVGFVHDEPDAILDGGECRFGIESTIISLIYQTPLVLRQGAIPLETIQRLIGDVHVADPLRSTVEAPGMLRRHYAPKTPLHVIPAGLPLAGYLGSVGVLTAGGRTSPDDLEVAELTRELPGDGEMILAGLYNALHDLDSAGLDSIAVRLMGAAATCPVLSDRIWRASSQIKEEYR